MLENVQFVGIDVDNKAFHISCFSPESDEWFDYKCGPSPDLLIKALRKHHQHPSCLKICYEASYVGFSLHRQLKKAGFDCQVAAPSLIPTQAGARQKTDKLDSRKLARFYTKGLLTFVYVPDESDEAVASFPIQKALQQNT